MPKAKRSRARLPGAPTRLPKVPLSLRALGGVDPRTLPPGTPYPCNDPAVGASVRGKHFAGKILGCATPPPGKHGRHFVVGGLESRSAIASAKRASERDREALRARYEGPDFDARPKRRAPRAAVTVAASPSRGFLYGIYRMDLDSSRVRPDGSFSPSFRRGDALAMEFAPSAAAAFDAWWAQEIAMGNKRHGERGNYWAWAVESPRNTGDWKAENARLRLARMSATYAPPTLDEDVAKRRQRAKNRGLRVVSGEKTVKRPSTVKRHEELPMPRPVSMRRRPEMAGPEWSPRKHGVGVDEEALRQAILAQMEAHNLPRSTRAADAILGALLHRVYPSAGALDPSNKTYRDIFAIFSGVKLPATIKGSKALIEKGEFTLLPPSQWSRGATPADIAKRDATVFNEARGILAKAFLRVFHGQFAKGESPIPGQRVSIAEVAVTPSFRPKGEAGDAKVYVVRLHEGPGVFAFMLRAQAPDSPVGLTSGPPVTLLSGSLWQKMLKGAIEK